MNVNSRRPLLLALVLALTVVPSVIVVSSARAWPEFVEDDTEYRSTGTSKHIGTHTNRSTLGPLCVYHQQDTANYCREQQWIGDREKRRAVEDNDVSMITDLVNELLEPR